MKNKILEEIEYRINLLCEKPDEFYNDSITVAIIHGRVFELNYIKVWISENILEDFNIEATGCDTATIDLSFVDQSSKISGINKKIIEYVIVQKISYHYLADEVKAHILLGWQPLDPVFFHDRYWCQKMVRYEER